MEKRSRKSATLKIDWQFPFNKDTEHYVHANLNNAPKENAVKITLIITVSTPSAYFAIIDKKHKHRLRVNAANELAEGK